MNKNIEIVTHRKVFSLFGETFTTTPSVVAEVLNVPFVAVKAIAKEAGITVSDEQSACLDEKALGIYADAYVRKLRGYFNSMKSKRSQLGIDDYLVFDDFCTNFKKPECNTDKACTWNDIDTDAIRSQFFELVKEKTPHKPSDLFSEIGGFLRFDLKFEPMSLEDTFEETLGKAKLSERQRNTLKKISERNYCCYKVRKVHKHRNYNARLRIVLFAAHYHIFSRDDKGDHDDINFNLDIVNGSNRFIFSA